MFLIDKLKMFLLRRKFRNFNSHNKARLKSFCDISKIKIGKHTYGTIDVIDASPSDTILEIGAYCSIAPGVHFLLGGEHPLHTVTTFPFKVLRWGEKREAISKGNIVIKDDVWIGHSAIICSGVTVGQGAVVAAGAIVTKDVPPYAIVGGNPAHVIKWRFEEPLRDRLCNIDIVKLFDSFSVDQKQIVYEPLTDDILNLLCEKQ